MRRSRRMIRLIKMLADAGVLAAAFVLAFLLRFEGAVPDAFGDVLRVYLPLVVAGKLLLLGLAGRYKATWRFTNLREVVRILSWLTAGTAILLLWRLLQATFAAPGTAVLPLGVMVLDLVLSFVGLVGMRSTVRLWSEMRERRRIAATGKGRVPTLLIGAGRAGALVAKEILARPDTGLQLVGFLDDDEDLCGMDVEGLPVLGTTADLDAVTQRYHIRQAVITIASAPAGVIRRIAGLCEAAGLITKIIPSVHEIVAGQASPAALRTVSIEDLLRRSPVRLDCGDVERIVRDQTVLVTGAGGSIGSELCRIIARLRPATLVLVDQAENNLFHIHLALVDQHPNLHIVPCIADICDTPRMDSIFADHRPSLVLHAAAHKHVPMMEWNPGEAVKNNVLGTRNIATLADAWHVEWFVMISTDKAVNPTSVMGVSKRVAELFIQALAQTSSTRFMTVRFGNVLGSAGSVIPIFQSQIASGGPVTVTHPEMRRYFMTIPEACQLVLQAAGMGQGGELFILDMGEPVKIVDLARDLIRLSGLCPDHDVEIRFTGLRPGEKLFEELSHGEEELLKTNHPRIFMGKVRAPALPLISRLMDDLGVLANGTEVGKVFAKLREIVPEYQGRLERQDVAAPAPFHGPHEHGTPACST